MRENEFRLDYFFNLSSDVMCVLNPQFIVTQVNLGFEQVLGFSLSELTGKSVLDYVHPEEKEITTKYLKDSSTSSDSIHFNNRMIAKDGSTKWFKWTVSNPNSSPYIFAVANDYTREQESTNLLIKRNREIAEDRAKTDALLSNIGDGVVGLSDTGVIQYFNESAEELLGYSEEEVINKLFFHTIPTVDEKGSPVDTNQLPIRNAMMTGRSSYARNLQFVKKDGKFLPVAITASTVKYLNTLMGGVVVFRDITKEKEIDRMKTEFISLASHQLRTPLSAMKWFSEMLLDGDIGELTEKQKEIVNNIYKSNERMIDLVNSLLNISRIESGRLMIDPKPTDLKELLTEVLTELKPKLDSKQLKLASTVHDNLGPITIDPKLVRHVYMNLLTNAIKYTPNGGQIIVAISRKGEEILSQVSDSGFGIPKSQQERVFQKFFRADNIKKVETDGTGLGLYLVNQVVAASGGKVWFESEQDKGTTFWFTLPINGSKPKEGEVSIDS